MRRLSRLDEDPKEEHCSQIGAANENENEFSVSRFWWYAKYVTAASSSERKGAQRSTPRHQSDSLLVGNLMNYNNVVILGGGPGACCLAILLARFGKKVTIFHIPSPLPILVGESLTPAVIPMLQNLGVEEEVREYSTYKPGACFTFSNSKTIQFRFDETPQDCPNYAYNVPRLEFDRTLMTRAAAEGVNIVEAKASLEVFPDLDQVALSPKTLEEADLAVDEHPDLVVDATGRTRLISNLLDVPSEKGKREDVALFAHMDRLPLELEGAVHTDQLDAGWCWRIPLPGRTSLGLVIPESQLAEYGETAEARYDNLLLRESTLSRLTKGAKRITPVFQFSNYQLYSTRAVGANWVLLGDSAGFIDPVFSSGLLIAFDSAFNLATALKSGTRRALRRYESHVLKHLKAWQKIIAYYYNGKLFTSFSVGEEVKKSPVGRLVVPHVEKHMGRIFTGSAAMNRYSLNLLCVLSEYGLRGKSPKPFVIR